MPRIKLEESLCADGRFIAVESKIGKTRAYGDYVRICFLAQNYWRKNRELIPKHVYEDQQFPAEFLFYGLVEERDDGYYLKGSEEHFSWLFERPESTVNLARKVALKQTIARDRNVSMDFLDDELKDFVSGVSDTIRRRWVREYTPETISRKLEDALEWCKGKGKVPKNVGLLMNKFFQGVQKDAKMNCPLDEDVQAQLDSLLEQNNLELEC